MAGGTVRRRCDNLGCSAQEWSISVSLQSHEDFCWPSTRIFPKKGVEAFGLGLVLERG